MGSLWVALPPPAPHFDGAVWIWYLICFVWLMVGLWIGTCRWNQELSESDVLVMTPEVLLHTLAHGVLKVRPSPCILLLHFMICHSKKCHRPAPQAVTKNSQVGQIQPCICMKRARRRH